MKKQDRAAHAAFTSIARNLERLADRERDPAVRVYLRARARMQQQRADMIGSREDHDRQRDGSERDPFILDPQYRSKLESWRARA